MSAETDETTNAGPPQTVDDCYDVDEKTGKRTLITGRLGQLVLSLYEVHRGGDLLYGYNAPPKGRYEPIEDDVRRMLTKWLGAGWKTRIETEVRGFIRAAAPPLWTLDGHIIGHDGKPTAARDYLHEHVNVANGILNVDTGHLDDHTARFLWPIQVPVRYDPNARCPRIDAFLSQVLPGDETVVHELAGLLLTPDVRHHKAVMLVGPGGNGKGVLLHLLSAFVGPRNVSARTLHDLAENRFAKADLYGKLANICGDLDARALKETGDLKMLTGGDMVTAERKHGQPFEFHPFARLIFSANQAPGTPDGSTAFFDRWLILNMDQRFRATKSEDPDLIPKLTTPAELSGLLNHALTGLRRLRDQGHFTQTAGTRKAATDFRLQTDPVAAFIDDCCTMDAVEGKVYRAELYAAYRTWCQGNGHAAKSHRSFTATIRSLDGVEESTAGNRPWYGIRLTTEAGT